MTKSELPLVAAGGFLGTLARFAVARTTPDVAAWPVGTLLVNVVGAFALGLLLERLAGGVETARRRRIRLLVGTGLLGSFTTYSSFALETERLLVVGAYGTAVAYVAASLVAGLVACAAGVAVAHRWHGSQAGA